jgi:ubiquinone/menaquinone biosynthesis C-methylase UbiE/uncharacterized protein YbaR (Trm112 family)
MSMEDAEYCCPRCKGTLTSATDAYTCTACKKHYPIILGIPDFRIFPDPYIDIVEDRRKAQRIFEHAAGSDFSRLVEYYWSITPDTSLEMARRFTAQAIGAIERGRHLLNAHSAVKTKLQEPDARVLDLGTRSGGLLRAAAEHGRTAVGIDIALRWLIIARKRLEEAGRPAQLVCCCAEFLPFRDKTFSLIVSENLLEHTVLQRECVEEAYRVSKPGGVFFATTWNRLALAPEPHLRLWGVGWLPRKLGKLYVKLRKGMSYDHVRLLSLFELKHLIRCTPFRRCAILLPIFSAVELANVSSVQRQAIGLYHRIKDWPPFRGLLRIFGPVFHLVCVREP